MGWCGTSRGDPYHPGGTLRWDGQLGPRPLGGMVCDIPGRPVPAQSDTRIGTWDQGLCVGWCGISESDWTMGLDRHLSKLRLQGILQSQWTVHGNAGHVSGESDIETLSSPCQSTECDIAESELLDLVRASSFNWFEVIDRIDESFAMNKYEALLCHLTPKEQDLLKQSHDAYLHMKETLMPEEQREAAAWNGEVVSESDTENPDDYLGSSSDQENLETLETLVKQRVAQLK